MYDTVYSTAESLYKQYEKQCHSKHERRCIDNSITGCNRCVGYCRYNEHPGFLTEKLRKQHNCIGKQCFHYVAKPKKENKPQLLVNRASSILSMVHQVMCQNEYARVIRVENTEFKRYNAYYVSITNECDFDRYSLQIKDKLDVNVDFINLNYDFDKCVALLFAN